MLEMPAHSYRKQKLMSPISYHSKQSKLLAILKHVLEYQQLLWTVMRYSKRNTHSRTFLTQDSPHGAQTLSSPVTPHVSASARDGSRRWEHFQWVADSASNTGLGFSLLFFFFLKHSSWQKSIEAPPTPSTFVFYCKYKLQNYQEQERWSERSRTS